MDYSNIKKTHVQEETDDSAWTVNKLLKQKLTVTITIVQLSCQKRNKMISRIQMLKLNILWKMLKTGKLPQMARGEQEAK